MFMSCGFALMLVQDPAPAPKADAAAEAKRALAVARTDAEGWRIELAGRRCELGKDMLLEWSNPAAGSIYGGVFVWSRDGLPVAAGSFYRYFRPDNHVGSELAALSEVPPAGTAGSAVWRPQSGRARAALADAPKPAATAVGRVTQMRLLAKEFVVVHRSDRSGLETLRLLPNPIHRYANAAKGLADGAVFAFVKGTDPEALLLLEAAADAGKEPAWRFAFAPLSHRQHTATRRGKEAWTTPELTDAERLDNSRNYTQYTRPPRAGE